MLYSKQNIEYMCSLQLLPSQGGDIFRTSDLNSAKSSVLFFVGMLEIRYYCLECDLNDRL